MRPDPLDDSSWNALAHAVLDGEASPEERARLSDEIAADPARARDFARMAMLHDAVERAWNEGASGRGAARRMQWASRARRAVLVAAMLVLTAGAAWLAIGTSRTASADEVLARIVEAARRGDRTYLLRVLPDGGGRAGGRAGQASPREISASATASPDTPAVKTPPRAARPEPRPPASVDGAVLYLRGPDRYVLARVDASGDEVLTGCDGVHAWIVPVKGPVRVSRDVRRFSGLLPGSQQGVAFVDPHDGLGELAGSYDVRLFPPASDGGFAQIVATRRAGARGGPKRIEIAYDTQTAVIRAMRLENLPQGRGGPRSVEFELVDDSPLGDGFFTHEFHHPADRAVIEED
ncbi:MAG: hypothetical protein ACOYMM_12235 [Phycisphaerales bacterium]